jgi:pyruvate,water dikinase
MINIVWFKDCSYRIKDLVGGKNASLGELYQLSNELNFNIADGFALTTNLYNSFLNDNVLEGKITQLLNNVNSENIEELNEISLKIKNLILTCNLSQLQKDEILMNFRKLKRLYKINLQVAVRSSAIAEDLPNASFAGQQDSYLNIEKEEDLITAIIKCYASLFNTRAISYRYSNNIDFSQVKMSVAIQKMVRSDLGSSGVAFSIDPETGYDKAVVINSAYGLGELVVSGGVKPDEFIVDKRATIEEADYPIIDKKIGEKKTKIIYDDIEKTKEICTTDYEYNSYSLSNETITYLSKTIIDIEKSYQKIFHSKVGIDTEWALDGLDNNMYIIQARPETIHSNNTNNLVIKKYILKEKSEILLEGVAVGDKISNGKVKYLTDISQHKTFEKGDILVTEMTTPDWEPIMKKASGIITDKGGRTCHAAIVARELGINAIVGTKNGTNILSDNSIITMSCAEGEIGKIYNKKLPFIIDEFVLDNNVQEHSSINMMLNVGSPENAFSASLLPNMGVGLARLEFIINNDIQFHPSALLEYSKIDGKIKDKIDAVLKISGHSDPCQYFIEKLAQGIGKIASAFYPSSVIVRLSDFKSNEYKNLIGGDKYEPNEENPMIGWRGASRYYSKEYQEAFILECRAIKYAIENMNMCNIIVMIPFCRTPEECSQVLTIMKNNGLERGKNGLKVYLMCEIPSNVIEADLFAPLIDGVSIGGNDLLQLTLGVDRDSNMISHLSNDKNISYRRMISTAINTYKQYGIKVGFCGQQPSDSVEFAKFLIDSGIDSISVLPDSILHIYKMLFYNK